MEPSRALEAALVELAWSHWTALGVSGWRLGRGSRVDVNDAAIDPEPLILLTAALGEIDPRLRTEALDWCVSFGRYISKIRLNKVLELNIGERKATWSFAATVNKLTHLGWPSDDAKAIRFEPTGRSELAVRGRASAIRVRARLIFGVSARAEILVLLGSESSGTYSATDVAERVRYGRRNVVEALDALIAAGLVRQIDAAGARRYSLADPIALHAILGPTPAHFIDWGVAFAACWRALTTLQRFSDSPPTIQAVEAAKSAEAIESLLMRTWLTPPRSSPSGPAAWQRFGDWALDLVQMFADPSRAEFAPRRLRRRVRKISLPRRAAG